MNNGTVDFKFAILMANKKKHKTKHLLLSAPHPIITDFLSVFTDGGGAAQ